MKKLYFLFILISSLSFGQTTIFNAAGGGAYPSAGWSDENNVAANLIDRTTYYLVDAGAPSDVIYTDVYDLSSYTSAVLDLNVATFGSGTANSALIEISYDGGANYTESHNSNTPSSSTYIAGGPINLASVSTQVKIKISNAGTSGRGVRIQNLKLDAYGTEPQISITSPSDAAVFNPLTSSVNVELSVLNFNVASGTGDGHIHYTITENGMIIGNNPYMKYDTDPIVVPVSQGNSYVVYVELVDNTHTPIAPAENATVNFSIDAITTVSNIAAVRADVIANGTGKYYEITSEALVTYTRPTNRNQKYIQDATAGILIDDNGGIITNTFNIGDGMTGLKGKTSTYGGVLQFTPLEDITSSSTGNAITPQVVTAADIIADVEMYESELVQINAASFTAADGTTPFAVNTTYTINDGNDLDFRTMFGEANYIGQVIPTGAQNITVLVAEYNGTPQVVARSLADMPLETKSFDAIDGLTMYPNPVSGNILNITSANNAAMNVQIFDILGKQVINTPVTNNTVNVSQLNAGVYIVKITEEGKTATRKLVVR